MHALIWMWYARSSHKIEMCEMLWCSGRSISTSGESLRNMRSNLKSICETVLWYGWSRYNKTNSPPNSHAIHPIACRWGENMGSRVSCEFSVGALSDFAIKLWHAYVMTDRAAKLYFLLRRNPNKICDSLMLVNCSAAAYATNEKNTS